MAGISIRKFIRWLPDQASEPTSTLVLTSPERRYVDIRILLADDGNGRLDQGTEEILPLERLDWAIAGTSSSSTLPDGRIHSSWRHWIDSRTVDAEAASDEGDMYPQSDGLTTLEKGRMVNPATGRETDYEELWFDPPPEVKECLVLQMEDEKRGRRGVLVRLGEWCQALVRDGEEEVVAERWKWQDGRGWRRVVQVGSLREMPCEKVLKGGTALKVGGTVWIRDEVWRVMEMAEL